MKTVAAASPMEEEEFSVLPMFARHETFHPRYGWLKKGFDQAAKHPDIFVRADAPVLLGVGKNMVRAIRYWCSAFKVLEEQPNPDRPRLRDSWPSALGLKLLSEAGWDPYLEHPASLWLLHWSLLAPPCMAPTWFATFNTFQGLEFTQSDLTTHIREFSESHSHWGGFVENSLKKDVDCLIRMYAHRVSPLGVSEDSLDSPLLQLGLIRDSGDGRHFYFDYGIKRNLPAEIVAFACIDYSSARVANESRTVSIKRLAYENGSPGRVMKLTESQLIEMLESASSEATGISIVDVGGAGQLVLRDDPKELSEKILDNFYRKLRGARL